MRFAACVEYDGSGFSGWQAQKHDVRTVQEEVEAALSKVASEPVSIITAGRTDTGVHGRHQVIHFDTDVERPLFAWCRGSNRFMAEDVRILWVKEVSEEFHARFSALSRSYRFVIYNSPIKSALYRNLATHEHKPLDDQLMANAGKYLIGEHDFTSFRAAGCQAHSPVRTIESFKLSRSGDWVWFDVKANAFLQHMVRNIAGSLIEVGCSKREKAWFTELLEVRDRRKAGVTAPPHGLYLTGVDYPAEHSLPSAFKAVSYW